MSVFERTEI